MKVRTVEMLVDTLTDDFAWRRQELTKINKIITSYRSDKEGYDTLVRLGILIIYAHWEGFVKFAASKYLEFVSLQGLRYSEISLCFKALVTGKQVLKTDGRTSIERVMAAVDSILNGPDEKAEIPYQTAIDAQANLKYDVFRGILLTIGLDHSMYETKRMLIDHQLLYFRHPIAHGERIKPDYDRFFELREEVLGMLALLKNQIENSAYTGSFKS